ncbi:MAG TPA: MFS transporter, partial [Burkholderiales bacterium]|nr:MFS transporter [Burkholderiales bacterium]
MSAVELRASIGLAAIFGLRMLGMFAILPVFAIYAERLPGGNDLTLVGIAIGAYGFTQAILQIPFGWWSDRYGRRPVIYTGLAIFAVGSFIAALGHHIYVVILGRILQGSGAISAAVMALAADLTREEHRTKAMAMIGSTVGATFALSLIAGPALDRAIGVPGIFVMTGVLALAAIGVAYAVVPATQGEPATGREQDGVRFGVVLADPQLLRLNYGVFALHAAL